MLPDGAVRSIIAGHLPVVIDHMKDAGVPGDLFARIIATDGNLNHLYRDQHGNLGNLKRIIARFKDDNIPSDKWGQILGASGAFASLTKNEVPKSVTRVTQQMEKKKR